jgi:hypothetical protein
MLPIARVIGHREWAPGRKSDPTYDMDWRRAGVAGIRPRIAGQEDDMDQAQVDQLRRDVGFARDQIMTHLGKHPAAAPLPPEQLAGVEVARRADVGFARDQILDELAAQRALLEAIAEKVGVPPTPPTGQT